MATVLVVDDEPDLRELVSLNLSLDGHRVVGAADGDEALDVAGQEIPDVILLDVMMPRRDGWDTLGAIKSDDQGLAEVPVLMLTARTGELDQVKGAIEGAIQYITKPFSLSTLRHAVGQALTGAPEPVQRRMVQTDALRRLARLERGHPAAEPAPPVTLATPRLTRLESRMRAAQSTTQQSVRQANERNDVAGHRHLSRKQRQILDAVTHTSTVPEAAERLGVSRSYVYASLRRIARKLGVRSGPELVGLARQGTLPNSLPNTSLNPLPNSAPNTTPGQ